MGALKNHPGLWLRDDAAAAINALEDKYGVIRINSAGRTVAEQQKLIDRWNRGGAANRPPYLYQPATPATASNHVANGGIAVDVYNYTSDRAKLQEFGFEWYGPADKVHYTFRGWAGNNPKADEATRQRQAWLVSRGWNLQVDGIEGPITRQAYKEYQSQLNAMGLNAGAVDGKWGPQTQAAHDKFWTSVNNAGSGRPSNKSAGELSYADIQSALNRKGYGLAVDGIWGPKSSNALADFQRKNGLTVDRIVGPATWAKLNTY